MNQRYLLAVQSMDTWDLITLARALTSAVQEAAIDGILPHLDPAVQLISYQVAMAGNGNLPAMGLYDKLLEFCEQKISTGPNFTSLDPVADAVPPEYKPN